MGTPPFPRKNRSPRSGAGSGKSTADGSQKAAERRAARPAERSVQRVWDASQQAETAISGGAGNRCFEPLWEQRHCLQGSELPSTVHFEQLVLVVTTLVTTTSVRRLSGGRTKFIHPTLLSVHFEPLPPITISVRTVFVRARLIQPLGVKWSHGGSALLGKQGVCIYKRSKRTSSVAAGNPFLLVGVAPQTL